jgi:putative transposase
LQGKRRVPKRIWNRLSVQERNRVLEVAKHHPELSSRLLAIKITDEERFCVSPTTVYRLLKQHGLITPKPLTDMPAAKSWWHKTKLVDEIWQSDATLLKYFLVHYWYLIFFPS